MQFQIQCEPQAELQAELWSDSDIECRIIGERNDEVKQIERDVSDLADIFTDLSALIDTQGESIETCVANTEQANINIAVATESLAIAEVTVAGIRRWLIGAGVTSAGITVTGAALTFVSLPIGLTAVGVGLIGVAVTGVIAKNEGGPGSS